jgi:hypothetical protein
MHPVEIYVQKAGIYYSFSFSLFLYILTQYPIKTILNLLRVCLGRLQEPRDRPRPLRTDQLLDLQVWISLLHRSPIRRPVGAVFQPPLDARVVRQIHRFKLAHSRQTPNTHDICGRELVASQILVLGESVLEMLQSADCPAIGTLIPWIILARSHGSHERSSEEHGLQITVREVEPIEIVGVVGMRRWESKTSVSMFVDEVIGNGERFCEENRGFFVSCVFDDWGRAHGVEGCQFRRSENGTALVEFNLVGDVEFLEKPWDSFSLADLKVVNCDYRCGHCGGNSMWCLMMIVR